MIVITVARKPVTGTVASNVLRYGCGGLNIDASRVQGPKGSGVWGTSNETIRTDRKFNASPSMHEYRSQEHSAGRWPANVILDENEGVLAGFPQVTSGMRDNRNNKPYSSPAGWKGTNVGGVYQKSSGSAARFFKQVKE